MQSDQQHHDAQHRVPAGLGFAHCLGQKCPQRQGRSEYGILGSPEGHTFIRKGLLDLGRGQHLGKRQTLAGEKRAEGLLERQRATGLAIR